MKLYPVEFELDAELQYCKVNSSMYTIAKQCIESCAKVENLHTFGRLNGNGI